MAKWVFLLKVRASQISHIFPLGVFEDFLWVRRGKNVQVKDNGSPSNNGLICQAPRTHFYFFFMVKARENTVEFKHSFRIWRPHGKMKVRRPVSPADVPKHIIASPDVWWNFTTSPGKISGQSFQVIFRDLAMAGELIYLFPFWELHLSRPPFKVYLLYNEWRQRVFHYQVSPCCRHRLEKFPSARLASLIYFLELSNVGRAWLTALLNYHYYTVMSWHHQGLSWKSSYWAGNTFSSLLGLC